MKLISLKMCSVGDRVLTYAACPEHLSNLQLFEIQIEANKMFLLSNNAVYTALRASDRRGYAYSWTLGNVWKPDSVPHYGILIDDSTQGIVSAFLEYIIATDIQNTYER